MENPNHPSNKQKVVATPSDTQALQVIAGTPLAPMPAGPTPVTLARAAPLHKLRQIVAAALRERVTVAAPPRVATQSDVEAPEEEAGEDVPVPLPLSGRRRENPVPEPQEIPPLWLARFEHLQKGLQDMKYQIEGSPEDDRQGIPFTETVMADELPMNCRTPAIVEYNGTSDPMEHLSLFENAALLHRYIDGIKCRVFVTTFVRAAQQWFNQLPAGAIGSFQDF
ncbi:UNVERIFIED_CONTAM: hypothetical protein Sradi_6995900 [Sesamum radiatum]|uniref:Retrotransposon gag domain-containing protein n=1 Tax=Sesamum radiatum TaxID=300843 RepID=A0AAW2JCS7_SESRA